MATPSAARLGWMLVFVIPLSVQAEVFVYPAQGQSAEQTDRDKFECYQWARSNSGFDPAQGTASSSPPPPREEPVGGVGRGAVRGGLGGLAVGAIAGDAGKGAAIGAVSGGVVGGLRRRDQNQRQAQAHAEYQQQQATSQNRMRSDYDRAYSACLEGRGYTVR